MGGEFMDERAEVKKKRSWWVKAAIWAAGIVVFLALAVVIAATVYDAYSRHEALELANLPVRERNLALFDAAVEVLKRHYYKPDVFKRDDWRLYEKYWRANAAESEPGLMLYGNVLGNFGAQFLDSHVGFEAPAWVPSTETAHKSKAHIKPQTAEEQAAWAQRFEILQSGPGFEASTIRRGRITATIVDVVRAGSAADRAGIEPGWALPFSRTTLDQHGVRFMGTFLQLSRDDAVFMEHTGHPPGVETAGAEDPYTLQHGVKYAYEPNAGPARSAFETHRLAGNVIYLRFDTFQERDVVGPALDVIDAAGPEGVVIDLRHNTGGLMFNLQRFLGRLLGNDVEIGALRDRDSTSRMRTWHWGSVYRGPVVVLIGPQSTSAAEIAAAALQDHQRATLVGRMTNGSVLESRKYPLPDGGTMMVPVSDFHRQGGRRIEGVGVEPDIHVMPTLQDTRAGRDATLERALHALLTTPPRARPGS
jgi:carboxyl-terminal processing protease